MSDYDASRLLSHVYHIVHNARFDLRLHERLPAMVWAGFEEFKRCYDNFLEGQPPALPTYLLARPLIGSNLYPEGYDPHSPIFTSLKDPDSIQFHAHHFMQYIGLLNHYVKVMQKGVSVSKQAGDSASALGHLFTLRDGNLDLPAYSGISVRTVAKPVELIQRINNAVTWPTPTKISVADLYNVQVNFQNVYTEACAPLDREVFSTIPNGHEDTPSALLAAWLYQVSDLMNEKDISLLIIRGLDPSLPAHPNYPWGVIWFLLDKSPTVDQIYALSLLVHECFEDAVIEVRAREAGRAQEWKREAERLASIKQYIVDLQGAISTAHTNIAKINDAIYATGSTFLDLYENPKIRIMFDESTTKVLSTDTIPVHDEMDMNALLWKNDYIQHLIDCRIQNGLIQDFMSFDVIDDASSRRVFRLFKSLIRRPHLKEEAYDGARWRAVIRPIQMLGACWAMHQAGQQHFSIKLRDELGREYDLTEFNQLVNSVWNERPDDERLRALLPIGTSPEELLREFIRLITTDLKPSLNGNRVTASEIWVEVTKRRVGLKVLCNGQFDNLTMLIMAGQPEAGHSFRSSLLTLGRLSGHGSPFILPPITDVDKITNQFFSDENIEHVNSESGAFLISQGFIADNPKTIFLLSFPRFITDEE